MRKRNKEKGVKKMAGNKCMEAGKEAIKKKSKKIKNNNNGDKNFLHFW